MPKLIVKQCGGGLGCGMCLLVAEVPVSAYGGVRGRVGRKMGAVNGCGVGAW